jgi:hypothetical protein
MMMWETKTSIFYEVVGNDATTKSVYGGRWGECRMWKVPLIFAQ